MIQGVGIIAEGRGDLAVLTNILQAMLGLERADIHFLRPEYDRDETDLHEMPEAEKRGSYVYVIEDCQNHRKFADFLEVVAEERIVVIHFDAAEAHRREFGLPAGGDDSLRDRLIARIREWTTPQHHEHLRFAIAVMETEAWLLAHYEKDRKSDRVRDAKRRLKEVVGPRERKDFGKLCQRPEFDFCDELSKDLRKLKVLREACKRNESLRLFCESLRAEID